MSAKLGSVFLPEDGKTGSCALLVFPSSGDRFRPAVAHDHQSCFVTTRSAFVSIPVPIPFPAQPLGDPRARRGRTCCLEGMGKVKGMEMSVRSAVPGGQHSASRIWKIGSSGARKLRQGYRSFFRSRSSDQTSQDFGPLARLSVFEKIIRFPTKPSPRRSYESDRSTLASCS